MNADRPNNLTGYWWDGSSGGRTVPWRDLADALYRIERPLVAVAQNGSYHLARGGTLVPNPDGDRAGLAPVVGLALPCPAANLGDPEFCADYGLQYPYVTGSMANGISSTRMVAAMARGGMLGFFGAGGLTVPAVEEAVDRLSQDLGDLPYGFNLIHSPGEPELEKAVADLYIRKGVRLVEASAFLALTLPLIRYRVHGIHRDPDGNVVTPNRVMAKASRVEVATRFFSPPPESFLRDLVAAGDITEEQARLAEEIPVAYELTAEADSGGHTDNRPAVTLLPTMIALKNRLMKQYGYQRPLRVGAAGGIGAPLSAVAAFSMGAAWLVTGSVNQSAVESGTCGLVRDMLAQAGQADVTMAPAADMFEMGVKVQVLKWGTMFAMRAAKLYELYKNHDRYDHLPAQERENLERNFFRAPMEAVWEDTREYFMQRDPGQVERAERDPKHRMALLFRWYLGQTSGWANAGDRSRKVDFQIFCGPAMGAFNEWVKGSFLQPPENRDVATIALNLLFGAAVLARVNTLRSQGLPLPMGVEDVKPLKLEKIKEYMS